MDSFKEKQCPFCAETILKDAKKCKHCHEFLDASLAKEEQEARKSARFSPGVAAVLSLIIPGAGQLYKGQIFNGLLWFVIVFLGYIAFIIPGLILHFCCIIGAASEGWEDKEQTEKQKVLKESMPERDETTVMETIQEYRREHPVHAIFTLIAAVVLLVLLFS